MSQGWNGEDVLEYLQPQYVVLCEVGQPPWVLENPNEFQLPKLTAQLRGNTEPIRDGLVGSWLPEDPQATMTPFKIAYYQRGFGVTFELSKAGMAAWRHVRRCSQERPTAWKSRRVPQTYAN